MRQKRERNPRFDKGLRKECIFGIVSIIIQLKNPVSYLQDFLIVLESISSSR